MVPGEQLSLLRGSIKETTESGDEEARAQCMRPSARASLAHHLEGMRPECLLLDKCRRYTLGVIDTRQTVSQPPVFLNFKDSRCASSLVCAARETAKCAIPTPPMCVAVM